MKLELTDEQINDVVIQDLVTQIKFNSDLDMLESLRKVLFFYLGEEEEASNDPEPESYMYGDPNNISITINGQMIR